MEVNLDIIKTKYSFYKHVNKILLPIIILELILLVVFFNSNKDIILKPLKISLLIYLVFNMTYNFIRLKTIKLGKLTITENSILVNFNNEEILIKINELVKCKFKILGYDGEANNPRGFSVLKGNFNYINIITKENAYKYEFYIPNQARLNKLRNLIKTWEKGGVNIFYNIF
jgi:hypothetical protein